MAHADLHVHSNASDGLFPPREVIRRAHGVGLSAVAITDHDTVAGVAEAEREARSLGLDLVPGCEISIDFEGRDIHLLAYFIDAGDPGLASLLRAIRHSRRERVVEMVRRLNQLGVSLTMDEVSVGAAQSNSIGRLHVARALLARGMVRTIEQAFREWIGSAGEAYLPKRTPGAAEVIAAVHAAGGVPVLAHPALYRIEDLEETFSNWDLRGIEVFHPSHKPADEERLLAWADARGFVMTGGSDWHGDERPGSYIGSVQVDSQVVAELRHCSRAPREC